MLVSSCLRTVRSRQIASIRFSSSLKSSYDHIIAEVRGKTGLITLNRPKALNALCTPLLADITHACRAFDDNNDVGAIVITGSEKAFAAGADIKEMSKQEFVDCYTNNMFADWTEVTKIRKPTIAAVAGYALGGGCELAMMCDIIIAADNAKFGQPEITLGVIPGCGGTQRLIRAVGKAKAMEMVLTGNMIDAHQAERDGLVCRVVPKEELVDVALKMGDKIASFSQPAVAMAKETVNSAYELSLAEGVRFERRIFHSMFALRDQKEGMAAFIEKRPATWTHR
ncbi:echs1 [Symbiodinium microadriaticum]|nr:echs1 [Symbiodinium microadriaticum]